MPDAEVVERLGVLRTEVDGRAVDDGRKLLTTERLERRPNADVIPGAVVGADDGPADQADGEVMLTGLVGQQAQ